jgi:hypothetical protein
MTNREARLKYALNVYDLHHIAAVVAAYTNQEIPPNFDLDDDVFKNNVSRIYRKLGEFGVKVSSREELARFAIEKDLPTGKRLLEVDEEDKIYIPPEDDNS